MLVRVAQNKNLFFKTSWARYIKTCKGLLRVVPRGLRLMALGGRLHEDATEGFRGAASGQGDAFIPRRQGGRIRPRLILWH